MQEILLKSDILKKDYRKALKKVTLFFFRTQSLSIVKIINKKKSPGTSDQSLLILRNKFRKILLLGMYYLTKFDDVI